MPNTTWSPTDKTANITLSNGNLTGTLGTGKGGVRALDGKSSGKYYFEVALNPAAGGNANVGFGLATGDAPLNTWVANGVAGTITLSQVSGIISINGGGGANLGTMANGAIGCIAVDFDNRLVWFRNGAAGNWNNNAAANPATASGGFSFPDWLIYRPVAVWDTAGFAGTNEIANFGDSAFTGAVPAGFTAGFPTGTPTMVAAVGGAARETIVTAEGEMRLGVVAREALVSTTTAVMFDGLVREGLFSGATPVMLDSLVRETLEIADPSMRLGSLVRETLVTEGITPPVLVPKQTAVTVNTG